MVDLKKEHLLKLASIRMPFGKYEGRLIMDLPEPYLLWFANKGFPEGSIGDLMQIMLAIQIEGLESVLEPLRKYQTLH